MFRVCHHSVAELPVWQPHTLSSSNGSIIDLIGPECNAPYGKCAKALLRGEPYGIGNGNGNGQRNGNDIGKVRGKGRGVIVGVGGQLSPSTSGCLLSLFRLSTFQPPNCVTYKPFIIRYSTHLENNFWFLNN